MKKLLLAACLLIAAGSFAANYSATKTVYSQTADKRIPVSKVPAAILAQFNSEFPGAIVDEWQKETQGGNVFYKVRFKLNGVKMHARYS